MSLEELRTLLRELEVLASDVWYLYEKDLPDAAEIQRQLDKQAVTIGIVLDKVRAVLDEWRDALVVSLESDAPFDWVAYANSEMLPALAASFNLAIQESIKQSGFSVSWTKVNPLVRQLAGQMAFELVNIENPKGIAFPRKNFLDIVRTQLGTGELAWVDLPSRLEEMFGEYRARLIARTETTTLWAKSHKLAATEAGMGYKRSIRAELGRPCPTNVCNDAQAEGWIPIGQDYAASGTDGPAYHPHCYCFEQFSLEILE